MEEPLSLLLPESELELDEEPELDEELELELELLLRGPHYITLAVAMRASMSFHGRYLQFIVYHTL